MHPCTAPFPFATHSSPLSPQSTPAKPKDRQCFHLHHCLHLRLQQHPLHPKSPRAKSNPRRHVCSVLRETQEQHSIAINRNAKGRGTLFDSGFRRGLDELRGRHSSPSPNSLSMNSHSTSTRGRLIQILASIRPSSQSFRSVVCPSHCQAAVTWSSRPHLDTNSGHGLRSEAYHYSGG